ncbi:MAG TPA: restriction endonuclease subunit R [Leptolyngbyaceae cyanobacterium M65_K2018_010]|nr:restriction endonuclease subunit R [Leptolyngbyaceae cyanobacterium M65_K2018_010]
MVTTIPASQVTLADLEGRYGLSLTTQEDFFTEWLADLPNLTELEQRSLDRVKANFTSLLKTPPLLENSVKMVVLSPLLDLAGFYQEPFRIESEPSIEVTAIDEGEVIRGRIDVLVLQGQIWVLVLESKRSDFAVNMALPQTLACMLGNPELTRPSFGLISNGNEFLFLKLTNAPQPVYANSRLFSLLNPGNDLYSVLQILKNLGIHVLN